MKRTDEQRLEGLRKRIRRILKRRKLTQRRACDITGVERSELSRILTGKKSPRWTEVDRLLELDDNN